MLYTKNWADEEAMLLIWKHKSISIRDQNSLTIKDINWSYSYCVVLCVTTMKCYRPTDYTWKYFYIFKFYNFTAPFIHLLRTLALLLNSIETTVYISEIMKSAQGDTQSSVIIYTSYGQLWLLLPNWPQQRGWQHWMNGLLCYSTNIALTTL